jgi:hypothetical protein
MPKGPNGQKRPADVIGNAVHVMRIATGETEEKPNKKGGSQKGGLKGGATRAARLSPEQRSAIAKKGATARWKKKLAPAD